MRCDDCRRELIIHQHLWPIRASFIIRDPSVWACPCGCSTPHLAGRTEWAWWTVQGYRSQGGQPSPHRQRIAHPWSSSRFLHVLLSLAALGTCGFSMHTPSASSNQQHWGRLLTNRTPSHQDPKSRMGLGFLTPAALCMHPRISTVRTTLPLPSLLVPPPLRFSRRFFGFGFFFFLDFLSAVF